MSENSNVGEKLLFFAVGTLIGAAIGILFAPRSGSESREFLSRRFCDGTDFLNEQKQSLANRAADLVQEGKDAVARQKESLAAAFEAGKAAYREEISKSQS
jgi:gas vesicle protein